MEHQKILNSLNEAKEFKFVTRKWNLVNDQSNAYYDVGNEIIYNTEVLESNLCEYNVNITITWHQETQVSFKHCTKFTKFITKLMEKQ